MNTDCVAQLRSLEGHCVSLALKDGSRIDHGQLISGGRKRARTLWLFAGGSDTFVAIDEIVDLWEASPRARPATVKHAARVLVDR
jgi:hypothetical protein